MSKYGNQSSPGSKTFLLVGFLALAVGALAVFTYNSFSSDGSADVQQEGAIQTGQQAQPTTEQDQPSNAATGTVEAEADPTDNDDTVSVTVIATDDPFYIDCLGQPNAEGETDDEHVAYCNRQLEQQQAQPAQRNPGPSPAPNLP